MTQPILKQRLSTLDATFLYYERKEAPFHVGSTMIFDGEITALDFEKMLSARLHLLPRYMQKVVPPPFNIGYPSWEFDRNFNIKNHIFPVQLDSPGTLEQLRVLTSRIQAVMLDRSKPLWEIYVVNGLQGKRTAIITKVHHTMVDGVSGVELMNISFDHTPDMPPPPPAPSTLASPPSPRPARDLAGGWFDHLLDSAMDITDNWFQLQKGLLDLGSDMLKQSGDLIARPSMNPLVTLATPVSVLPFNQPNSGNLDINWHKFSFKEAHSIEERLGGTVNDVMLCVVSGAVIRYLKHHGFDTDNAVLRFFVPVNTRRKEDTGTMGNKVSALPVEVPLRLHNCMERYHHIVKETGEMKRARVADQFSLVLNAVGVIPPPLQALIGSLMYTTVPLVNMVCTNVPGPHFPLYMLGKRLVDNYSYVPFAYAVGLTCVIFSYDHSLFISLSSDGAKMPGLGKEFMRHLGQVFSELRDSAGILSTEIPVVEPLPEEPEVEVKSAIETVEKPVVEVKPVRKPAKKPEVKKPVEKVEIKKPAEKVEIEVPAPAVKQPPRRKPAAKAKKVVEKAAARPVIEETTPPVNLAAQPELPPKEEPETKLALEAPVITVPVVETIPPELSGTAPQVEPTNIQPETEPVAEIAENEIINPVPEAAQAAPEVLLPPVEPEPVKMENREPEAEVVSPSLEVVDTPAAPVGEGSKVETSQTPELTATDDHEVNFEVVKPAKSNKKKAQPDETQVLSNIS